MNQPVPTLDEFLSYCRETLKYLEGYGFKEVSPPPYRNQNKFELWFKADKRTVIVTGDRWGTSASIHLEHDDGLELSEIYLVPKDKRPKRQNTKMTLPTQLEQISQSAKWLREYGVDFLEGNLTRFFKYARPLPPYKLPKQDMGL
jgi:hypothetical protein